MHQLSDAAAVGGGRGDARGERDRRLACPRSHGRPEPEAVPPSSRCPMRRRRRGGAERRARHRLGRRRARVLLARRRRGRRRPAGRRHRRGLLARRLRLRGRRDDTLRDEISPELQPGGALLEAKEDVLYEGLASVGHRAIEHLARRRPHEVGRYAGGQAHLELGARLQVPSHEALRGEGALGLGGRVPLLLPRLRVDQKVDVLLRKLRRRERAQLPDPRLVLEYDLEAPGRRRGRGGREGALRGALAPAACHACPVCLALRLQPRLAGRVRLRGRLAGVVHRRLAGVGHRLAAGWGLWLKATRRLRAQTRTAEEAGRLRGA